MANFLLVRGKYAYLGNGWTGCGHFYECTLLQPAAPDAPSPLEFSILCPQSEDRYLQAHRVLKATPPRRQVPVGVLQRGLRRAARPGQGGPRTLNTLCATPY